MSKYRGARRLLEVDAALPAHSSGVDTAIVGTLDPKTNTITVEKIAPEAASAKPN